jgi:uncharacterized OsmC-like protein
MAQEKKNVMNGVNVDGIVGTVQAIQEDAEIAQFRFRVENRWVDGARNETTITEFDGAGGSHEHPRAHVLVADEPEVLLGADAGPNPAEYSLTALASCLTTTLVYHAATRGIPLKSVESRLESGLDLRGLLDMPTDGRSGFKGVEVSLFVDSDAPAEQIDELIELTQRASPVLDVIRNPVPVTIRKRMK